MAAAISPEDVAALHDARVCPPSCCDLCDAADAPRPLRCVVCWTQTDADAETCAGCGQVIDPVLPLWEVGR